MENLKNYKSFGFTLIELLAVIIILAIVALIATPIILNVIEDARISAGRSEANMILSGINNYCATEDVKYQLDNSYTKICTSEMDVNDVPTMVNLGNATIESIKYNGSKLTELVIESNNHKFTLCSSGQFVMDDEECNGEVVQGESLISLLLKQYNSDNTTGLLKDTTNENLYYYKGTKEQVANNFLWYGGHQWRVLEFDTSTKTLTLITQQPLTAIQSTNNIWTSEETYNSSYINDWLNDYFWNSLDSDIQSNILDNTFNVGIYTDVDEITTIKKVGLLDNDQYVRAGSKNSYLDIKDYFWLGNRYSSSVSGYINYDGIISNSNVSGGLGVRAVVMISDINIVKGEGTLMDSYRTSKKSTNTNNIQVGEYVNVPYSGSDNACGSDKICTFRVISKDSDSIKVTLNGLLSKPSSYGNSTTISTENTIYTPLTNFVNSISNEYVYIGNKTFYIGDYPSKTNYKDIKDETLTAKVGLPTVGEMFSGNDIDLNTSNLKTFVDVNTIENSNISDYYWTMNRFNSSIVLNVYFYGGLIDFGDVSNSLGVRPVMYLKNNLTFTSGEGTAQNPYMLQ